MAQESPTVLPLKAEGTHWAWVDAGLGQLCFSEKLHLLSGLVLPAEKDDKLEEEAACLRVWG